MDQKTALEIAAKQVQLAHDIIECLNINKLNDDKFHEFRKTVVALTNLSCDLNNLAAWFAN